MLTASVLYISTCLGPCGRAMVLGHWFFFLCVLSNPRRRERLHNLLFLKYIFTVLEKRDFQRGETCPHRQVHCVKLSLGEPLSSCKVLVALHVPRIEQSRTLLCSRNVDSGCLPSSWRRWNENIVKKKKKKNTVLWWCAGRPSKGKHGISTRGSLNFKQNPVDQPVLGRCPHWAPYWPLVYSVEKKH